MTAPIANGESGSSVRTKLNSIIVEVDGLGTAADYATAAQGVLADSAQQPPAEGPFVDGDKTDLDANTTKLAGIEAGAEVNTINTTSTGEPITTSPVENVVSISQADYNTAIGAGTTVATTFYIIT